MSSLQPKFYHRKFFSFSRDTVKNYIQGIFYVSLPGMNPKRGNVNPLQLSLSPAGVQNNSRSNAFAVSICQISESFSAIVAVASDCDSGGIDGERRLGSFCGWACSRFGLAYTV
jgi:hypothetical protein